MKRFRLNSTLFVKWKVIVNNYSYDNLTLFLIDPRHNKTKVSYTIEEDTIVCFTFYGEDLKYSGSYSLSLVANYKQPEQQIIDAIDAFTLVPFLDEENDTVYIDTNDVLTVGIQGDSAYQSWLNAGNTGSEADFVSSLKMSWNDLTDEDKEYLRQPAEEAAQELTEQVNSLIEDANKVIVDLPAQINANIDAVNEVKSEVENLISTNENSFKELSEQVTEGLEANTAYINEQVVSLNSKVDTKISEINSKLSESTNKVNSTVNNAENKIKSLTSDVSAAIKANKANVDALTVKVDAKLATVDSVIETKTEAVKTAILASNTQLENKLSSEIEQIKSDIDNISIPETDLTEINSKITANSTEIKNVKTKLSEYDDKITTVNQLFEDLSAEFDNLEIPETDLSPIQNELTVIKDSISVNKTKIEILLKQVNDVNSKYTDLDNVVSNIDTCICDLTDVENTLSYLKSFVRSIDTRVENIETRAGYELKFNEIFVRLCDIERRLGGSATLDLSSWQIRLESLENRINDDNTISDYNDTEIRTEIEKIKETVLILEATNKEVDTTDIKNDILDIQERLIEVENKEDKDTVYDDTEIKSEIVTIKQKIVDLFPEIIDRINLENLESSIDDLSERLIEVENKEDKDTVYNDDELRSYITNLNTEAGKLKSTHAADKNSLIDKIEELSERIALLENKEPDNEIVNPMDLNLVSVGNIGEEKEFNYYKQVPAEYTVNCNYKCIPAAKIKIDNKVRQSALLRVAKSEIPFDVLSISFKIECVDDDAKECFNLIKNDYSFSYLTADIYKDVNYNFFNYNISVSNKLYQSEKSYCKVNDEIFPDRYKGIYVDDISNCDEHFIMTVTYRFTEQVLLNEQDEYYILFDLFNFTSNGLFNISVISYTDAEDKPANRTNSVIPSYVYDSGQNGFTGLYTYDPVVNFYNTLFPDGNVILPGSDNFNQELYNQYLELLQKYNELSIKVQSISEREDKDTIYDDTFVLDLINTLIENKPAPYDDTEILDILNELKSKLQYLYEKEDKDTVYDDTELRNLIKELYEREDKDTVYDDTELRELTNQLSVKYDNFKNNILSSNTEVRELIDKLSVYVYQLEEYIKSEIQKRITNAEININANKELIETNYSELTDSISNVKEELSETVTNLETKVDNNYTKINNKITEVEYNVSENANAISENINAISEINTNIADINTEITGIKINVSNNVDEINSSIRQIKSDITAINADFDNFASETGNYIVLLNDNISDINSTIELLDSSVSDRFDEIEADITELEINVSELNETVSNNYSEYTDKVTEIDSSINSIKSNHDELSDKVYNLESVVNDNYDEYSNKVSEIETNVSELNDGLTNANNELTSVSSKVSNCESEISDIKLDITEIYNTLSECATTDDLGELENTVSMKAWKSDLEGYQTQLDNYKIEVDGKINSLTGEHLNMKEDVLNVGKDVVKLENRFVNNKDKVNDEINSLINRIEDLEKRPSVGADGNVDLSGIQAQITDLYNKYNSIEFEDNDTIYDDTEVRQLIADLSTYIDNLEDNDTIYDDTEVRQLIADLSTYIDNLEDNDTIYDDSSIVAKITDLSIYVDNLVIPSEYDDTNIVNRIDDLSTAIDNIEEIQCSINIENNKPEIVSITDRYSNIDYNDTDFNELYTKQLKGNIYANSNEYSTTYPGRLTFTFTNTYNGNLGYIQFPCCVGNSAITGEHDVTVTITDTTSNTVLYTGNQTVSFEQAYTGSNPNSINSYTDANAINFVHELKKPLTVKNQVIQITLDFNFTANNGGKAGIHWYKCNTNKSVVGTKLEIQDGWTTSAPDSQIVVWSKSLTITYYDDTEIKSRLEALENKENTDGYDDTALRYDVSTLENKVTDLSTYVHSQSGNGNEDIIFTDELLTDIFTALSSIDSSQNSSINDLSTKLTDLSTYLDNLDIPEVDLTNYYTKQEVIDGYVSKNELTGVEQVLAEKIELGDSSLKTYIDNIDYENIVSIYSYSKIEVDTKLDETDAVILAVKNKVDNLNIPDSYDDTALRSDVSTLETKLTDLSTYTHNLVIPDSYDDTELRTKITDLSTYTHNLNIPDTTNLATISSVNQSVQSINNVKADRSDVSTLQTKVSNLEAINHDQYLKYSLLTLAEYDDLTTKAENTLYIITE